MNAPTSPLLSVVVPTRNRYETLSVLIEQLMAWPDQRFELVVEDNSADNTPIAELLARHGRDPRFSYSHSPAPRSAIENCDAATARIRGEVATFIGDDDSITRQCIDVASWMLHNQSQVMLCELGSYTWPDMVHAVGINKILNGRLLDVNPGGRIERVDVATELKIVAREGARTLARVPRFYQALVRRDALNLLRARIGTCFPGPVPDMSNAVALASVVSRCHWTDVPIVISGQSRKSMSGRNAVRQHQGSIRAEPSLPQDAASLWDERVPAFWSGPTIWAEAALKAAGSTRQVDFTEQFSFAWVYANCLSYNKAEYYPLVFRALFHQGPLRGLLSLPKVTLCMAHIAVERAINLLRKLVVGAPGQSFGTVADAATYLEQRIEEEGLMRRAFAYAGGRA